MKALVILTLSLVLVGCNNTEMSRSALWSVDHIAHATAGYGAWNFDRIKLRMHSRQQKWIHYNEYRWGGRPEWRGEVCAPAAKFDPCSSGSGRLPAVMRSPEMKAPKLGRLEKQAYEKISRAYGIDKRASILLLEALNRAAVGDFGGLKGLGLDAKRIAFAHLNGGQLDLSAMEELSRALKLDPLKIESIIQSIYGLQ